MFRVVYLIIHAIVATGAHGKTIDLPLRNEGGVGSYPRLVGIKMLKSVLLLMFPLHMLLLVAHGIPPDVQETISPDGTVDEEGAEVEATTVLRDYQINGVRLAVASGRACHVIEVGEFEGVCDVQRIIDIDVTVSVSFQIVEYMRL